MSHWHLTSYNWLESLPIPVAAKLRDRSTEVSFKDGEIIFSPSKLLDHVYIQEGGLTRIYYLSDDAVEFTLSFVEPGEVFGGLPGNQAEQSTSHAIAMDDCNLLEVPRAYFSEMLEHVSELSYVVTKQVFKRLVRLESRAVDLVCLSAYERLGKMICMLAVDLGAEYSSGTKIGVLLSQVEWASLIGASRPTTNIAFKKLRVSGMIKLEMGYVVVLNMDRLKQKFS